MGYTRRIKVLTSKADYLLVAKCAYCEKINLIYHSVITETNHSEYENPMKSSETHQRRALANNQKFIDGMKNKKFEHCGIDTYCTKCQSIPPYARMTFKKLTKFIWTLLITVTCIFAVSLPSILKRDSFTGEMPALSSPFFYILLAGFALCGILLAYKHINIFLRKRELEKFPDDYLPFLCKDKAEAVEIANRIADSDEARESIKLWHDNN